MVSDMANSKEIMESRKEARSKEHQAPLLGPYLESSLYDLDLLSERVSDLSISDESDLDSRYIFPYTKLPAEFQIMICQYALLLPTHLNYRDFKVTSFRNAVQEPPSIMKLPTSTFYPAPELLAALRCNKKLYSEALVIFYDINTFFLCKRTINSFMQLKPPALQLITRISISVDDHTSNSDHIRPEDPNILALRALFTTSKSRLYHHLNKLKHVEILFSNCCTWDFCDFAQRAESWPALDSVSLKFFRLDRMHCEALLWQMDKICIGGLEMGFPDERFVWGVARSEVRRNCFRGTFELKLRRDIWALRVKR